MRDTGRQSRDIGMVKPENRIRKVDPVLISHGFRTVVPHLIRSKAVKDGTPIDVSGKPDDGKGVLCSRMPFDKGKDARFFILFQYAYAL